MHRAEQISRRLKLRQLEVLLAVAQAGSMAKAAEHLAISQPVVSKTIADLENTLGMRLFDRSPQGVQATLYGSALLKRSTAVFNDLRTSVAELDFLSDPTAGELRIGSSEALAAGMLGVIIDRLSRQHPRLTFEVTLGAGLIDLQYRELQTRSIDLIIGRLPSTIPSGTEAEILYPEKFLVVAGTQNRWTRRRNIELAELIDEPWCAPSFDSFPWSLIGEAFRARGLDLPRRVVTTRSLQLTLGLVLTGRFVSVLPQSVLHFGAKSLGLKILPVDTRIQSYPVGIVTLANRTLSPVGQIFIDCARKVAKTMVKSR